MTLRNEGWWWPGGASSWHYMRDGRSLCGYWNFAGGYLLDCGNEELDNCATCRKKRDREVAQKKKGAP